MSATSRRTRRRQTAGADRTGNGQRAVIGRIEHVDLAVRACHGIGVCEVPTGCGDAGAVIAVTACCRDEGALRLCLRWRSRQRNGKRKRRRDEDRACHWKAPFLGLVSVRTARGCKSNAWEGSSRARRRSIFPAGRIWRPRNVLQYLPRDAWQLGNVHRDKERLVARQQIGSSAVFHNAKCRYWPIAAFRCGAAIRSFWNEADIGLSFMS